MEFLSVLDRQGQLLYVNDAALSFVGRSVNQVVGRMAWASPWFRGQAAREQRLIAAVAQAAAGNPVEYLEHLTDAQGKQRAFVVSATPLSSVDGSTPSLLGRGRPLSENESSVSQSMDTRDSFVDQFLEFYRKLLQGFVQGGCRDPSGTPFGDLEDRVAFIECDRFGDVVAYNKAAIDLFGAGSTGTTRGPLMRCFPNLAAGIHGVLDNPDEAANRRLTEPMAGDFVLNLAQGRARVCYAVQPRPNHAGALLAASALPDELKISGVLVAKTDIIRLRHALHDGPCNDLVALRLQAEALRRTSTLSAEQRRWLDGWLDQLQAIENSMRGLIEGWQVCQVGAGNFTQALERLAADTQAAGPVRCVCRTARALDLRDDGVAENLYLIVKEALANAVRHSGCSKVEITIGAGAGNRLVVADNGRGYAFEQALIQSRGGVASMRFRAHQIGASLSFRRASASGLVVDIAL